MPVILSERGVETIAQTATRSGAQANVVGETKQEVCLGPAGGDCAGGRGSSRRADRWIAGEGAVVDELASEAGVADVKDIRAVVIELEPNVKCVLSMNHCHGVFCLNDGVVELGDE